MEKRIKAVTGNTTVVVVTSLVILLITLITVLIAISAPKGLKELIAPILVDVGLIGLCIYCYLSVTTGYVIDNGNIRICRRKGDMIIAGSDLTSVTPVSRSGLGSTIRVGANGGLFGFFGNFYSANLGKIDVHANSFDKNLLLLELKDRKEKVLIAPVEPTPFLHR